MFLEQAVEKYMGVHTSNVSSAEARLASVRRRSRSGHDLSISLSEAGENAGISIK